MNTYEFITDEPTTVRAADLPEAKLKAGLDGPMLVIDITELRMRPGRCYLVHPIERATLPVYDEEKKTCLRIPLRYDGKAWMLDSAPSDLTALSMTVDLKYSSPLDLPLDGGTMRMHAGDEARLTTNLLRARLPRASKSVLTAEDEAAIAALRCSFLIPPVK